MINIRDGAGVVVAADVQGTVASVDDALLNGARMLVSILEAFQDARVPAAQSQKLFETLSGSMDSVIAGRKDLVSVIRQLSAIQGRSNLAAEAYGCPEGWTTMREQVSSDEEIVQPVA